LSGNPYISSPRLFLFLFFVLVLLLVLFLFLFLFLFFFLVLLLVLVLVLVLFLFLVLFLERNSIMGKSKENEYEAVAIFAVYCPKFYYSSTLIRFYMLHI